VGCWGVVLSSSVCAPLQALSRPSWAGSTVDVMGDTREQECAGRGDGRCPGEKTGVPEVGSPVFRCVDCWDYWDLDATEPGRRPVVDDGLTRPMGDPREAGPGTAA